MRQNMTIILDNHVLMHLMPLLPVLGGFLFGSLILYYIFLPKSPFPIINAPERFDFTASKAKARFVVNAKGLIKAGYAKADIFRLFSDNGTRLILSRKYLNEIRSHPSLTFTNFLQHEVHGHIRGFEPFRADALTSDIFSEAVRKRLTQAQGKITRPISDEASNALHDIWTDDQDWHDVALYPHIQRLIARVSCKVFLGDELCHNEDWFRVTTNYAGHVIRAAEALRLWPRIVRPIVAMFLESTRTLQREVQATRDIMMPILEKRRKEKVAASKAGITLKPNDDAMQWMEDIANARPYDPAVMQLALATAAILTTTDFLTQALFDLVGKEGLISELREEMLNVLREDGMKKTTMYKLQLLDSCLKESQRLKPIALATFRRMAMDTVTLNDGTIIEKGTLLMIPNDSMWDSECYENPESYDPYRFLKLRQVPNREHFTPLVSVSPEHMGFGIGKHACPGRFFAVNEMKIVLCHILLKYELKLADGAVPQIRRYGVGIQADTSAKIAIRRREEEIDLQNLAD